MSPTTSPLDPFSWVKKNIPPGYEFQCPLGLGGFGAVVKIKIRNTPLERALKMVRPDLLSDSHICNCFLREARLWITIGKQPNIVYAESVDRWKDCYYLVLELIQGDSRGKTSLQDFFFSEPIDVNIGVNWIIQVCQGLEQAYEFGIKAHRDIKPSNILINRDGIAKITDFGISSIGEHIVHSPKQSTDDWLLTVATLNDGSILGTPLYMSPEQFENPSECDQRSDIYALGLILYQIETCGQLPFDIIKPKKITNESVDIYYKCIYHAHLRGEIRKLDSRFFPIIKRCLEKTPSNRFQTISELRRDLIALVKRPLAVGKKQESVANNSIYVPLKKGDSFSTLGEYTIAIKYYEEALAKCVDSTPKEIRAVLLCNFAQALISMGDFKQGIDLLTTATALNPNHDEIWGNLGEALMRISRYEEALDACGKAIKLAKTPYPRVWRTLGMCYLETNQPNEALHWFEKSTKGEPDTIDGWWGMGHAYCYLKKYSSAIPCFIKYADICKEPIKRGFGFLMVARCAFEINDYESTLKFINLASRSAPSDISIICQCGELCNRIEDHKQALIFLENALRIDSKNAEVWYQIGAARACLKENKEAITAFRQSMELSDLSDISGQEIYLYAQQAINTLICKD